MTTLPGMSHWLVTVVGQEEDHGIILRRRNWVWEATAHLLPLLTGDNGDVEERWFATEAQVLVVPCQWQDPAASGQPDDSDALHVFDAGRDHWLDLSAVADSLVVGEQHRLITSTNSMGWEPLYGDKPAAVTAAALKQVMTGRPTCRLRQPCLPLQVWYHPHRTAAPKETGASDLCLAAVAYGLPVLADSRPVSQITVRADLFLCPV